MAYTKIQDVKRVLNSSTGQKVRFSDTALKMISTRYPSGLSTKPNRDIILNTEAISVGDEFGSDDVLVFKFTDATNFEVYRKHEIAKQDIKIGDGDIATSYTTPEGSITVGTGFWGGVIEAGDLVELQFSCHMSIVDFKLYLKDVEVIIDSMISDLSAGYVESGDRIFNSTVPAQIKVATTYLAAYYIFSDTFADVYRDKDELKFSFVSRWKKRAEEMVKRYANINSRHAPSSISFPSFMDKVGDDTVGPGLTGRTSVKTELERDALVEDIFEID